VAYYESMALADCYHPQTILAYELNGNPLDVPHGAPLRLRFERQLGLQARPRYVMMIQLVETLGDIGGGKGGVLGGSRLRVVRQVSSRNAETAQQEEVSRHLDAVRTWPSAPNWWLWRGRLSSLLSNTVGCEIVAEVLLAHSEIQVVPFGFWFNLAGRSAASR